jgi:putative acetyltransferase
LNKYSFKIASNQDVEQLKLIYTAAIQAIGSIYYTPEQIAAWSSFPEDRLAFSRWIIDAYTIIAISSEQYLGFAGLQASGRISALFVAPQFMRQGVASFMLQHLMSEAQTRQLPALKTEASEFSKPVFEKFGFEVETLEYINYKNVDFTRYVMKKIL